MNLFQTIAIILNIFTVQANNNDAVFDHFFRDTRKPPLIVKEGVRVTLNCSKVIDNEFYIITFVSFQNLNTGTPVKLIDSSNMTYNSKRYGFIETKDNTYLFTINRISGEDDGFYRCVQNYGVVIETRSVNVIYSPSESSPRCSSNHKSHVIFNNEMTQYFIFNCTTERGKPPIITRVYVNEREVTSDLKITNETLKDEKYMLTTYSMSQHFNDTLQNYHFVCNVTQELPFPHDDYQGSCSFGPLHLLPGFSLSVSPSNVTVRDESKVTVTCKSNVTGVEITWNNIPSEKYIETNHNGSSVLTILSFKPSYSGTVTVECSGSYGSRTITANTTVHLMNTKENEDDINDKQSYHYIAMLVVIIVFGICLFSILLPVIVFNCWKRKKSQEIATNSSSVNDIANPSISNLHGEGTLTTKGEANRNANNTSECLGMCKNISYEPASFEHMATGCCKDEKMLSGKNRNPLHEIGNYDLGDDHLICENVIYQSF